VDYKGLRKLVVAASRMSTRTLGRIRFDSCHWLSFRKGPDYGVPIRYLILNLFLLFLNHSVPQEGSGVSFNL